MTSSGLETSMGTEAHHEAAGSRPQQARKRKPLPLTSEAHDHGSRDKVDGDAQGAKDLPDMERQDHETTPLEDEETLCSRWHI